LAHRPRRIPAESCVNTAADVCLSQWHAVSDGRSFSFSSPSDMESSVLLHTGFLAKEVGDYGRARTCAWSALKASPRRLCSWRFMLVSMAGNLGKLAKKSVELFVKQTVVRSA